MFVKKEKDVLQYNQVKRKGAGNDYVGIRICTSCDYVINIYHSQKVKKLEK